MKTYTLSSELLHKMDDYCRAANYLSIGQIYLYDNPLMYINIAVLKETYPHERRVALVPYFPVESQILRDTAFIRGGEICGKTCLKY
jgi:hypothetical protein